MKSAVLVGGAFFIHRYRSLNPNWRDQSANEIARNLYAGIHRNLRKANKSNKRELYRILFYDCEPLTKKVHNPITHKAIDFSTTREASFRFSFHKELKNMRKVALRLGRVADNGHWTIKPKQTKSLLNSKLALSELTENDVTYDVRAKRRGYENRAGYSVTGL